MEKNTTARKITSENVNAIVRRGYLGIGEERESFVSGGNITLFDFVLEDSLFIESVPTQAITSLVFKNCIFKNDFSTSKHGNIGNYKFINCRFEGNVTLGNLMRDVSFESSCIFMKDVLISSANAQVHLTITNSLLIQRLKLSNNFFSIILDKINEDYTQDKITGELQLLGFNTHYFSASHVSLHSIHIKNSSFHHEVSFSNIETKELSFNDFKIGLLVEIKNSEIGRLILDNTKVSDHKYFSIKNKCQIENASIPFHQLHNLKIENSTFGVLKFWGTNLKDSIFNVENVSFRELYFDNITNLGKILLKNITADRSSIIRIISSDLGKSDFILCNFSKGTLEFINSKLTEVFLAETDFPKRVLTNEKDNPGQAQLAFGQLQTAFQKQGDTIRTLEYHSREIEAHFRAIYLRPKEFFNSLNLLLNMISNNFGRWWWLGIIFTFAIGLIFFFFILEYSFEYPRISLDNRLLVSYLKFMNPIRSFDTEGIFKIENKNFLNLKSGAYVLDFIGKILIAYGYYQTIQAFRRFGRK